MTKKLWTGNIDDALNFSIERWSAKAERVLKECAEFFGEDYEAQRTDRQNRTDDRMVLDIITGIYPMGYIDNWRYLASLARLAQAGKIRKKKRGGGWRIGWQRDKE